MASIEIRKVKVCSWTALLYNVSKVFAILPSGSASKLYPVCLISLELSVFAYTFYEKNVKMTSNVASWTIQLMALLNDISVTASLAACVIRSNFVHRHDLISFADKCAHLHQINFKNPVICTNLLFLLYISFNWYNIWSTLEFWPGMAYAYRDIINFHLGCFYLLLTYYAVLLNTQMTILRDTFKVQSAASVRQDKYLKTLAKEHFKLSALINAYSSIFGVDYLFLYVNLVINCMTPLNLLYKYSIATEANRSTSLVAVTVIWFLFPIIFMWFIIRPCNDVTQESLEIANKCHELEYEDGVDDDSKAKLKELSSKIIASPPAVSAANCFPVNFAMASSVLSAVATYFIVLVQFNQNM